MSKKTLSETENNDKKQTKKSYKSVFGLLFLLIVAGAGYAGWKNYDVIKDKLASYYPAVYEKNEEAVSPVPDWAGLIEEKADKASIYTLQEKLSNMQNLLNQIILQKNDAPDMTLLNERIDNMQDLLIASVNGKADAQSVLGIIVRLDKLENELSRLSRYNNDGALILATVTMIKQSADEGKNFVFEAQMLSELAGEKEKIAEPLMVIEESAEQGVATNEELSREFASVYEKLNSKNAGKEQSWKERLISKFNELISIKKTDEKTTEDKQKDFMKALKSLADEQKFAQIVKLIQSSNNKNLNKDLALQEWSKKVEAKQDFETAVNKISSYSLVLMKMSNLQAKE